MGGWGTYISTDEGWLYLVVVMDIYLREVLGSRTSSSLVCDALTMVLFRRKWLRGVIMLTDRGGQQCSQEHRKLLHAHG